MIGLVALLSIMPPVPPVPGPPVVWPTRDVSVTYRGNSDLRSTVSWRAIDGLSRTDISPELWSVFNRRTDKAFLVDEKSRKVTSTSDLGPTLKFGATTRFFSWAVHRIAGIDCREWDAHEGAVTTRFCLTNDGVVLREQIGLYAIEAIKVEYIVQDPRRFLKPLFP